MSSPEHALAPQDYNQQPLPTPRAFLTSLLKSLSTDPSTSSNTSAEAVTGTRERTAQQSNPLSAIPASKKSLLATLHVLFPPPTLLQALDLLDRGLVTRTHVSNSNDVLSPHDHEQEDRLRQEANAADEQQHPRDIEMNERDIPTTTTENKSKNKNKNTFFTVRSAQSRAPYRHGDNPLAAPGLIYTVYMHSWSCSCAAFAFSAFPPLSPSRPSSPLSSSSSEDGDMDAGGLSITNDVPICKHLLACLLAECWEEVFGAYVKERRVSREEAGGICAG
jgi:hypothetical protein